MFVVQAVERRAWPRLSRLTSSASRADGLHARGQLVAGDAGLQVVFAGMVAQMPLIDAVEQRELPLLRLALQVRAAGRGS